MYDMFVKRTNKGIVLVSYLLQSGVQYSFFFWVLGMLICTNDQPSVGSCLTYLV